LRHLSQSSLTREASWTAAAPRRFSLSTTHVTSPLVLSVGRSPRPFFALFALFVVKIIRQFHQIPQRICRPPWSSSAGRFALIPKAGGHNRAANHRRRRFPAKLREQPDSGLLDKAGLRCSVGHRDSRIRPCRQPAQVLPGLRHRVRARPVHPAKMKKETMLLSPPLQKSKRLLAAESP
jgi:hypothetical protein